MLLNLHHKKVGLEFTLVALNWDNMEILYASSSLLMDLGLKSLERSLCDFRTFSVWVPC